MKEEIEKSIFKLDRWVEKNGWAGYDPYDIQALPLFLEKNPTFPQKLKKKVFSKLDRVTPLLIRKFLGIEKLINPKAIGLFAEAYLNLFEATKKENYLDKAKECLSRLENNYSEGYSSCCWGYPFDWQSKILIPKNTPSAVVSATCGNALWKYYRLSKDKKYLKMCESICKFFLKDLNIDELSPNKICFSYTPIDNFHVHNANLFVAEFLIKIGKEIRNPEFIEKGLKAVDYTLSEQNKDGSMCYWGKDQEKTCRIDHYHSGFEIRSLYSIWKLTSDEKVYQALSKYCSFYLKNLFEDKTIPKITPKDIYPINIHACAEAILCNSLLQDDFSEAREYLENSVRWIIKNMQTKEGWFIYQVKNIKGLKWKIKIPYIRWGQAWMLNALSYALLKSKFHE